MTRRTHIDLDAIPDPVTFRCIVCRKIENEDRNHFHHPQFEPLPPVCWNCELDIRHVRRKARGWGHRRIPLLPHGPARDKRMLRQIAALEIALRTEALEILAAS